MSNITNVKQDILYNGLMVIVTATTDNGRSFWAVASTAHSHDQWRVRVVETSNNDEERDVVRFVRRSTAPVLPSIIEAIQTDLAQPAANK